MNASGFMAVPTFHPHGPTVSHIFYVDSAIFVGDCDRGSIKNISPILKCFHIFSGLKVNFHKSRLFCICTLEPELQNKAYILGCLESLFSFTYLGVPVGANMLLKKH